MVDWFSAPEGESDSRPALAWYPDRDAGDFSRFPDEGGLDSNIGDLAFSERTGSSLGFSLQLGPSLGGPLEDAGPAGLSVGPRSEGPLTFPKPGATVGRFRLLSELGRGAFARVFLAEQIDLADRPVALKVSAAVGDEPQNLARLQHAHIVPIHSVHDDPETGLRLICMPYVGGANLAQVLQTAESRSLTSGLPVSHATGRSLIEALDELNRASLGTAGASVSLLKRCPSRDRMTADALAGGAAQGAATRGLGTPARARSLWAQYLARLPWWHELEQRQGPPAADETEPARRYLRSATFVQAAVWIAARLAEALEHAHERGILHRDLKPSNVLIAADGTPMLLDFNLSADITAEADGARAQLGGTLPYMAPEHLDAFNPEGTTPAEAVGPAADLYSLGLILYEMVAGVHPFTDPPELPRLSDTLRLMMVERAKGASSARQYNPLVPHGLDSILRMCLDPDPERRYARAGDLAEDLRRLLDDRPLKFAPETSVAERLRKWSRRHPRASSASTVGSVAVVLLLVVGIAAWTIGDRLEASRARLSFQAFGRQFQQCQIALNSVAAARPNLDRGLLEAELAVAEYNVDRSGRWLSQPKVARLPAAEQRKLRMQLAELIQLRERCRVRLAASRDESARLQALREALAWLDSVEQFDPEPSLALEVDREVYRRALGDTAGAEQARRRALERRSWSARDLYLLGTANLILGIERGVSGALDQAASQLAEAATLDPKAFWNWFALGQCYYQQRRYAEAAGVFGTCSALAPDDPWPYLNRGLALAAANDPKAARLAYDQALKLDPSFIEALVNRALVCLELDEPETAERDLARAIELGRRDPALRAAHAEALARLGRGEEAEQGFAAALEADPQDQGLWVARGMSRLRSDPDGARSDFEQALRLDPQGPRAHYGLAHLERAADPRAALEHLDAALRADSDFGDALQLRALVRARLGDRNAVADVDRLVRVPTPHRLYNAACALAVLARTAGDADCAARARELLARAFAAGFDRAVAAADPDLAILRAPGRAAATAP